MALARQNTLFYVKTMRKVFGRFLEDISQCFLQRDLQLWQSRLVLPFSMITKHGPVVLTDDAVVAKNFELYLKAMDAMGLDLVDRTEVALEDCKDGTWLGTFQTRLLSGGNLATAPYTSTALLHIRDDRFLMSSLLNARGHSEWTGVTDA